MKRLPAFTLIELLVVVSLMGLLTVGGYTAFLTAKNNQDLSQSTDHIADTLRRGHIFSRDARDDKEWGVESNGTKQYEIVSRSSVSDTPSVSTSYTLPPSVQFDSAFEIWFGKGSGDIPDPIVIVLKNTNEQKTKIQVERTGVVSFEAD